LFGFQGLSTIGATIRGIVRHVVHEVRSRAVGRPVVADDRGAKGVSGVPTSEGTAREDAVTGSFHSLRRLAAIGAGVLALGGCSFSTDALWPSLSGEPPSAVSPTASIPIRPSQGELAGDPLNAPPRLGQTDFRIPPPQAGQPTGTFVGQKVDQLRQDLVRLQDSVRAQNGSLQQMREQTVQNALGYHSTIAGIQSRLQIGTTPGNPRLVDAWSQAQRELEQVNNDIGLMNGLANRVSADAALSTYLLEAVRAAYGLSGAVEEDHRQLAILEDDTNQTVVLVDRLLTELSDDIRRQSTYVGNERQNLNALAVAIKHGELFGTSLANRTIPQTGPGSGGFAAAPMAAPRAMTPTADRRPLVVIRFDRPNVQYEQPLYSAVSRALERRPEAFFDVVAVSPQSVNTGRAALDTNAARRNAQNVLRSLTDMGLPTNRVALSATTAADADTNEVRIFVR